MRRRVVAASVPVGAVALAWASLEAAPARHVFVLIALTSLSALLPGRTGFRIGLAAAVIAGWAVSVAGLGPSSLVSTIDRGLKDLYLVSPPVDVAAHPEVHLLIVLGAVALALTIALMAEKRPFLAGAFTAGAVGWPTTIIVDSNTTTVGVLTLVAALWPVVVRSRGRQAVLACALAATLVVGAAAGTVAAGARPSAPALAWQSWDLFGATRASATVTQVWDANYGGIDFPSGATTVLRIVAPRRALYWRATTLDSFAGDRWIEAPSGITRGTSDGVLPTDPLLPPDAAAPAGWVEQKVEVRALIDDHVIAVGQPMRIDSPGGEELLFAGGGVMRSLGGAGEMRRYTVWSYVPRPGPAALDRSPPEYPAVLDRYRDLGRAVAPPYGAAGRDEELAALFHDDRYQPLWPYEEMWLQARRLTAQARSPYEATIALERWLRTDGAFAYDEHPPRAETLPPLADFVARSKRGYCQQFAGAMTLMLRFLGIPARVAAGFTSGTWKDGGWNVADRDAHTWVEVWFAGHGWLAFDPTPGRGTLTASYTNASDSADAIRALGSGRYFDLGRQDPVAPSTAPARAEAAVATSGRWWVIAPFAGGAAAIVLLGFVKHLRRRRRYATADPRSLASGARAELAGFLLDQGSTLGVTGGVDEIVLALRRLGVAGEPFAHAFSRARYGPPEGADVAADELARELRRARSRLRGRLGPARRIRGFFAVRSLRAEAFRPRSRARVHSSSRSARSVA